MDLNTRRFAMRWSRLTWIVTVAVTVLIVVAVAVILWVAIHAGAAQGASRALLIFVALLSGILLAGAALFVPVAFEIKPDAVVVKRVGRDVIIPRRTIREVRRLEAGEMGFSWRLCGSGGFLGWFGLFYSRGLGRFWAYAGNQEDLVLLTQTDGRKIVISPHPPEAFLEAFRKTGQSQN